MWACFSEQNHQSQARQVCWDVTTEVLAAGPGWLRLEDQDQEIRLLAKRLANESLNSILL